MMNNKPMVGSSDTNIARQPPLQLVPTPSLPPEANLNNIQFDTIAASAAQFLSAKGITPNTTPSLGQLLSSLTKKEAA